MRIARNRNGWVRRITICAALGALFGLTAPDAARAAEMEATHQAECVDEPWIPSSPADALRHLIRRR
jgi:hypothetical protein